MAERTPPGEAVLLDAFWDALLDGSAPVADDPLPTLTPTLHALHRLPTAPGPTPHFVARLAEHLMPTAAALPTTTPAPAPALQVPNVDRARRPVTPPPTPDRRPLWRRATDLAAVAALLAAVVGGGLIVRDRDPAAPPLPAIANRTPLGATPAAVSPGSAMEFGNAARSGEVAGPGPRSQPELRWRVPLNDGRSNVAAASIAAGDTLYLASVQSPIGGTGETGSVAAFDATSGAERWRTEVVRTAGDAGMTELSAPAVDGDRLVVAITHLQPERRTASPPAGDAGPLTVKGTLVALDVRTGAERWRVSAVGSVLAAAAIADGLVYAPTDDGGLVALDAATGTERWRRHDIPWGFGAVAVADGLVFVVGGQLHAFDARTGQPRWRVGHWARSTSTPVVADGLLYLVSTETGADVDADRPSRLYALDAASGLDRWSVPVPVDSGLGLTPLAGAGVVILAGLGDDFDRTIAFDAATGQERWRFATEGWTVDQPLLADNLLYLHGYDQGLFASNQRLLGAASTLYALDIATGTPRWSFAIAQSSHLSPTVANGILYLLHAPAFGSTGLALQAYAAD